MNSDIQYVLNLPLLERLRPYRCIDTYIHIHMHICTHPHPTHTDPARPLPGLTMQFKLLCTCSELNCIYDFWMHAYISMRINVESYVCTYLHQRVLHICCICFDVICVQRHAKTCMSLYTNVPWPLMASPRDHDDLQAHHASACLGEAVHPLSH